MKMLTITGLALVSVLWGLAGRRITEDSHVNQVVLTQKWLAKLATNR